MYTEPLIIPGTLYSPQMLQDIMSQDAIELEPLIADSNCKIPTISDNHTIGDQIPQPMPLPTLSNVGQQLS